ncbi:MAG: hypothetical protein ACOVMI_03035 [Chitinophagaceae bacterium]
MKKIFATLLSFAILGLSVQAQTKQEVKKPATTTKAAAPKKADGTPDMRYKANQKAAPTAKPAGPTKADGSPDMRYKANQKAAPTATPKKKG